ncbi:hypothetical protein ACA910_015415 [Epithemia clementina (nom. ined.)]
MDANNFAHQEVDDTTIATGFKDDISVSTLDLSLCQAFEEIFGDDEVLNMVVSLNADLFQQPFCIQSSECEIDFTPPLDIQLHQAYEEIFGDHGASTMLSTSDGGLFYQPFHLQPDEYEVDFANIQGHEPIENENGEHQSCLLSLDAMEDSAFPSFTVYHDLREINQIDGETHLGLEGEIHIVKDLVNQVDGETHFYRQEMVNQVAPHKSDGETHLDKIDHKTSHCLGHDIGLVKFSNIFQPIPPSGTLPGGFSKVISSSASNGDPSFLDYLLCAGSTSAFPKTGYVMVHVFIWVWRAHRVKKKKNINQSISFGYGEHM